MAAGATSAPPRYAPGRRCRRRGRRYLRRRCEPGLPARGPSRAWKAPGQRRCLPTTPKSSRSNLDRFGHSVGQGVRRSASCLRCRAHGGAREELVEGGHNPRGCGPDRPSPAFRTARRDRNRCGNPHVRRPGGLDGARPRKLGNLRCATTRTRRLSGVRSRRFVLDRRAPVPISEF